ncbi:MAG: hypothetical protein F4049_06370 [Gemmatimonadetes bacterium]|nr:hypothetical protein [Gemmatimonadota bacterium]
MPLNGLGDDSAGLGEDGKRLVVGDDGQEPPRYWFAAYRAGREIAVGEGYGLACAPSRLRNVNGVRLKKEGSLARFLPRRKR